MATSDSTAEAEDRRRPVPWGKLIGSLLALAALYWAGRELGGRVPRFAAWVDSLGFWAPLVFVLGYAAATVAFIPGSVLTLAAGAVFGLLEGTIYAFLGAALGATGAFLVARYLARSLVEQRLEGRPRFRAVDRAVEHEGLKIVALLRLAPVFPFNLLNYVLGLTKVRLPHYLAAHLAMLPGTFLYVYYGKALGSLAAVAGGVELEKGAGYWTVFAVGLLATIAVTVLVTRTAQKALASVSDLEPGDA